MSADPIPSAAITHGPRKIPAWSRLLGIVLAVVIMATALPFLALPMLFIPWLALGLIAALPGAANASVRAGHGLRVFTSANPLHFLRRSAVLRVTLHGALGLIAVAVLLFRLSAGGAAGWLGAAAGIAIVVAVMQSGRRMVAHWLAPVHSDAALRQLALWGGVIAVMVATGLAAFVLGAEVPDTSPTARSTLVTEAFAAHRLWVGVGAWILTSVAALNLLPPLLEAVLATVLLGVSSWAVAALTVAALMPARDWYRAVGVASDDPEPPAPQRLAVLVLGALATLVVYGTLQVERQLAMQAPDARPVAQVQMAAERIGGAYFTPGTHAAIMAGRAELAEMDAAVLADLKVIVDAGFDAIVAQVDPFLDNYYSLSSDYFRVWVAAYGFLQGDAEAALAVHLNDRLQSALDVEHHLRPLAERLGTLGLDEAREAQLSREVALQNQALIGINPARLRVVEVFTTLEPLPELRTTGLTSRLETRLGGSVAVGPLSVVVARRVLQRLAARGVIRLGARAFVAVLPFVGVAAALGSDKLVLMLEEQNNREDFRAEIIAAIDELRGDILAELD